MPRSGLKWARVRLPAMMLWLVACIPSGSIDRQAYRHGRVGYRVGALPAGWQPIHFKGENLAFRHHAGGTIAAKGHCPAKEDVPLAVLTNHLLFGIETKREYG